MRWRWLPAVGSRPRAATTAAARRMPSSGWPTPAPIVASYGGKDHSPMGASAARRLERVLTKVGVDHDIKVYPEASHGFLNDHPPADRTPLRMVLNMMSGTRYHEPSAQDARRRIVAFFNKHLKS